MIHGGLEGKKEIRKERKKEEIKEEGRNMYACIHSSVARVMTV